MRYKTSIIYHSDLEKEIGPIVVLKSAWVKLIVTIE